MFIFYEYHGQKRNVHQMRKHFLYKEAKLWVFDFPNIKEDFNILK